MGVVWLVKVDVAFRAGYGEKFVIIELINAFRLRQSM